MKVLYVSKALAVAAYRDKLPALAEYVDITAVVPERWSGRPPEPGLNGATHIETQATWFAGRNHLHVYRGAAAMLERFAPDLVHIDEEPYSAVTCQLARLCALRGLPTVFFAWQNLGKRLPPPFNVMRSYVFRNASGAIAGTHAAAVVLREFGYAKTLAVIPQLGVDPERFCPDMNARAAVRRRIGALPDDFVIGYAGRLVREKGVHVLLEAARGTPGSHVLVTGDGPERRALAEVALAAGQSQRVHFVGAAPSLEMPKWLAACDVLVLPTIGRRGWVEQFGRILVEAMACGVPVIGSNSGEIPRVVGDAGLIVPMGNVLALNQALVRLAENPDLRATLGGRGRARVLSMYTHARVASATAEYYASVLSGSGAQ